MHLLRATEGPIEIDPRNFAFGDSFAVIRNDAEFLRRVAAAAVPSGQELKYGLVRYVGEGSHNGEMGPFFKRRSFDYQREYRIALLPGTGERLTFNVAISAIS